MRLKSLLLGSAAAMTVVSGAQAADAIMAAAPEPVDYVRVCDAFGTGYFYIPGTETCLKIGGYVRTEVSGGDLLGLDGDGDGEGDSYAFHTRFSLTTETNSQTELGVLHTYTETRFNYNNNNEVFDSGGNAGSYSTSQNFAYIELAGFRVGKTESIFTVYPGYAGAVINDTLVGYGPFDAQQISYTYTGENGFSATIGVEDDNGGSDDVGAVTTTNVIGGDTNGDGQITAADITTTTTTTSDGNYIPDVVGGIGFNAGGFGIKVVGAYDESLSEGAVKARVDGTIGRFTGFLMAAYSTNGDETGAHGNTGSVTSYGSNHFARWGGDYALFGGFSIDLTEKISMNTQVSYDEDENFGAVGNLQFHVVPGFDITTELDYADAGGAVTDLSDSGDVRYKPVDEAFGAQIRFQRSF